MIEDITPLTVVGATVVILLGLLLFVMLKLIGTLESLHVTLLRQIVPAVEEMADTGDVVQPCINPGKHVKRAVVTEPLNLKGLFKHGSNDQK